MPAYDVEAGDKFVVVDRFTGEFISDAVSVDTDAGFCEVWAKDAQGCYEWQDYRHIRKKLKGRFLVFKDERTS